MSTRENELELLLMRDRGLVAANLRARRAFLGHTLEAVREGTGLGLATISDAERGLTDLQLSTISRLALFYEVDVVDFFADPAGRPGERLVAAAIGKTDAEIKQAVALLAPYPATNDKTRKLRELVGPRKRGRKPRS